MFNPNQPYLTDIEIALFDEQFAADLKTFFSAGKRIVQVLLYVAYLLIGQLYTSASQLFSFVNKQMAPINAGIYQTCVEKKNPAAQFISGLLKQEVTNNNGSNSNTDWLYLESQNQQITKTNH
jgi:hypothetical protein